MQPFSLEMPRRILFGAGALSRLPELAAGLGRRVLLCTGSGWFARSPWNRRVRELLAGFEVSALPLPPGEPESGALDSLLT
jgi:alcohol dehydrogenase